MFLQTRQATQVFIFHFAVTLRHNKSFNGADSYGNTPYVGVISGAVTVATGFEGEVQLVMKDHRTAVSLEPNQISHLRQRARGSAHCGTNEN